MLSFKKRLTKERFFLILIIILAFIVRVWRIQDIPSGFFSDEASIGYNAYSILKTGKDEYGKSFPIFFRSFGDYRPPISIYSTIPFIIISGLSEAATRMQSVFYGLITIVSLFYLGKQLSSKNNLLVPLLTTFIGATMPWLIHYNRTGFEFSSYAALFTLTFVLLLKSITNKAYIIPSFITASLTLYTYQPARLLVPLIILGAFVLLRKSYFKNNKYFFGGLSIFILLGLPLILSFFTGEAFARYKMITVFSDDLTFIDTAMKIAQNYLTQLSPLYFISGEDTFITRHFVKGLRPLLFNTIPFFYLGFVKILLNLKKDVKYRLILLWILLYPIAGAVTCDPPFTSRSIIGAPIFAVIIALGVNTVSENLKRFVPKNAIISFLTFLITIDFILFAHFYFNKYTLYSSDFWGWQYGPKLIMQNFLEQKNNYTQLCIEKKLNSPYIFIKFYDPENLCRGKCQVCNVSAYNNRVKQLFAISQETYQYLENDGSRSFEVFKTIKYPNNQPAFYLGELYYY